MYRKTVLDNGLRVVTERMPGVRSLTIGLILEVGSRDETAVNNGVAHCIEHLLFQGTTGRDAATLAKMIDMAGGQLGAFTGRDYTCLYAAVLDDYRTFALDLFGDILLHSLFEPESLRREQSAILQEMRAGAEQPAKFAQELLKGHTWQGHALGRNIYGSPESVKTLTPAELQNFFAGYYGADRLIISAAGNVDHEDFLGQVNDALWALPPARQPRPRPSRPVFTPSVTLRRRDSAHVYFAVGAPAPAYTAPNRYAVFVLNAILGAGMGSRLFQKMRGESGWVYEIGSNYHPYYEAGMLVVEGFTTPDNLLPVIHSIVGEFIGLQNSPITPDELWRAKEYLRGEILISAEASNTRMSQLATQELYFGRFLPLEELIEGVRAITADEVQALASELFVPGNLSVAAVGPFNGHQAQLEEHISNLIGLE
jgi:predicted Zn-dependent peptidase